jgi:murein DD-endopeptidase MepM/ murein hydrolase activator NlpD
MYPVDVKKYPVNCAYGVKGPRWAGGIHKGIDQACPVGTTVRSPVDGVVVGVGVVWGQAFGRNQVTIEFVSGKKAYTVILAHMSAESVEVGQKVKAGDIVGKSGKDGNVTGPHMHMEVQKQRRWLKDGYVDPKIAINFKAK